MSISQRDLLFDIKLPIRVYFDNGTRLNELMKSTTIKQDLKRCTRADWKDRDWSRSSASLRGGEITFISLKSTKTIQFSNFVVTSQNMSDNRYQSRGVSAGKDVHNAIKKVDKGYFLKHFAKLFGLPYRRWGLLLYHARGWCDQISLAYMYWKKQVIPCLERDCSGCVDHEYWWFVMCGATGPILLPQPLEEIKTSSQERCFHKSLMEPRNCWKT